MLLGFNKKMISRYNTLFLLPIFLMAIFIKDSLKAAQQASDADYVMVRLREKNHDNQITPTESEMIQKAVNVLRNSDVQASMQLVSDVFKAKDVVPLIFQYATNKNKRYANGQTLEGHKKEVYCLRILSDGRVATGSD